MTEEKRLPSNAYTIIDHLSPSDGLAILRILAREDDRLVARIAEVATSFLTNVDPEEIALDLYDELDALNVEEIWDRAGATRHGYTEPEEVASEMIEQVIESFWQEMHKYAQMGFHAQARQVCIGLLLGLYQFEHESTNEFKDWAAGEAAEFAREVIRRWKSGSPSQEDIHKVRHVIDEQLKGWVIWR